MARQKKYVSFLLHFYQPFWQDRETLARIIGECYDPLFELFLGNDFCRLSVNVNYSLLEMLETRKHDRTLDLMRKWLHSGRGELIGTAAHHPILPLIPEKERIRQIELNRLGAKRILGLDPGPGFFPPEMAVARSIVPQVKNQHQWLIADDAVFSHPDFYGFAPSKFIPRTDGLLHFMRSGRWSNRLAFPPYGETASGLVSSLDKELEDWFCGENSSCRQIGGDRNRDAGYIIIALDAETFGHHHRHYQNHLLSVMRQLNGKSCFELKKISELIPLFPAADTDLPPSSWSLAPGHIKDKHYYPLWRHPMNSSQLTLWEIMEELWRSIDENDPVSRDLADRAINSCQFWWLSAEYWHPGNAVRTMPAIISFFKKRFGSLPSSVNLLIRRLEYFTGEKIL